jgi:hypothetical protein
MSVTSAPPWLGILLCHRAWLLVVVRVRLRDMPPEQYLWRVLCAGQ